jgi:general secretion pathway protein F
MRYRITALDPARGVSRLTLEALSPEDARSRLLATGVTPLSIRSAGGAWPGLRLSRSGFSLPLFTQELLALLEAGLSLGESLETLADRAEHHEGVRDVLVGLLDRLRCGERFSGALAAQPAHFPELYVATVRAAERSGDLVPALSRYLTWRGRVDEVRSKVISASLYPLMLIGAGLLVTLFLLTYVVPRFAGIYADSGRELPVLSQWLLGFGRFINDHTAALALGAVVVLAALGLLLMQKAVREALARAAWHLPALGERLRAWQLARFYRTTAMLLEGGMAMLPALALTRGLLGPALSAGLADMMRRIEQGQAFSQALQAGGLATPVALRLARVGERGGRLPDMLERTARFHDDELARWIDRFTRLFEPLLMAVIGLVIGGVVVLMYLPIFDLAGSLQ